MGYEEDLIFLCIKDKLDKSERNRFDSLLDKDLDWEWIIKYMSINRIIGYASKDLIKNKKLPEKIRKYITSWKNNVDKRNRIAKRRFESFLPDILKYNKKIMLLKGTSYRYSIFKKDMPRRSGDIDILVKEPYIYNLVGRFEDHYIVPNVAEKGVFLEYHKDLNIGWIGVRMTKINMGAIWDDSSLIDIKGYKVHLMKPEDEIIYLSYHNVIKRFSRSLYRFIEMREIIRQNKINWDEIISKSRDYKTDDFVWVNLYILNSLFKGVVPGKTLKKIKARRKVKDFMLNSFKKKYLLYSNKQIIKLRNILIWRADTFHKMLAVPLVRTFIHNYIKLIKIRPISEAISYLDFRIFAMINGKKFNLKDIKKYMCGPKKLSRPRK